MITGPDAVLDALLGQNRVLLTGPVRPDGDSLGACLALSHVLRDAGVQVCTIGDPGVRFRHLPGTERLVRDAAITGEWPVVVVLDGDRHRLMRGARTAWAAARMRGVIDHHRTTYTDGYDLYWVEPAATSTCAMLHASLVRRGWTIAGDLATLLHAGTLFDTGGLRFSNTTADTLRRCADRVEAGVDHTALMATILGRRRWRAVKALGHVLVDARSLHAGRLILARAPLALRRDLELHDDDLEGVVDLLADTAGVEIAALLYERTDGHIKASLRARGNADVCALAKRLTPDRRWAHQGGWSCVSGQPRRSGAHSRPGRVVGAPSRLTRLPPVTQLPVASRLCLGPRGLPSSLPW